MRLGRTWVAARGLLSGATPLARVAVAEHEEENARRAGGQEAGLISSELGEEEGSWFKDLIADYEQVFSPDHRQPARCKLDVTHMIPTGEASPQKTRTRRIPPKWEAEINRQLEEMLAAEPPLCLPSQSPCATL